MNMIYVVYFHLATMLCAFMLGAYLMFSQKGGPAHRLAGKVFSVTIIVSALASLFMHSTLGPTFLGRFGLLHLLSLWVLFVVPQAWLASRRHHVKKHRLSMIGIYVGAIGIAGTFAVMPPGRILHDWLFGWLSAL
ncbi:MAG: DUF2306 domain-containing protein [Hyphomicrobiales bacterium]